MYCLARSSSFGLPASPLFVLLCRPDCRMRAHDHVCLASALGGHIAFDNFSQKYSEITRKLDSLLLVEMMIRKDKDEDKEVHGANDPA